LPDAAKLTGHVALCAGQGHIVYKKVTIRGKALPEGKTQ
jgi:hypothetical protein